MTENSEKEEFEIQKLKIEIDKLSEPIWKRSSFWVPIFAACIALAVGKVTGYFDIKLEKLENKRDLLKIETHKLEESKNKLQSVHHALYLKNTELRLANKNLNDQNEILIKKLKNEAQPIVEVHFDDIINSRIAGFWLKNTGKGVANIEKYTFYLDGKEKNKVVIDEKSDWVKFFKIAKVDAKSLTMTTIRGKTTLSPRDKLLILKIDKEKFTNENYKEFISLSKRIGINVQYTNSLSEKNFTNYGKIPNDKNQ